LGLAKVKKLPPQLATQKGKMSVDLDTVKAVISNRFQIMSQYYKQVVKPTLSIEKEVNKGDKLEQKRFQGAARLFKREDGALSPRCKEALQSLLSTHERLRMVYNYRQSLQGIWLKTASSQKELVDALQQWCKQAEESGLEVLKQFAAQIKSYVPKQVMM